MKSIKSVGLSIILAIAAFCSITYAACTKDKCKGVECRNGGVCKDGNCTCPTGFIGTNCELDVRKFAKTWLAKDTLAGTTTPIMYYCSLTYTPDELSATFANSSFTSTIPIMFDASGNRVAIAAAKVKDVNNNQYVVNGIGDYNKADGSIRWNYNITKVADNSKKVYTGTWK